MESWTEDKESSTDDRKSMAADLEIDVDRTKNETDSTQAVILILFFTTEKGHETRRRC